MKKKTLRSAVLLTLALVFLMTVMLSGCIQKRDETKPAETEEPIETEEPAETTAAPELQDGDCYEAVIMIEGMEETVKYQHVRNETAGFQMDFDYENFVRRSESDRECFVSVYDDPKNPENYLEVSYSPEDASAVVAAVCETLSADYEILKDPFTLGDISNCTKIDASAAADGSGTPDILQAVYVIPAADGCRVARMHYSFEGGDGFGNRLASMVETISVMDAQGERALSSEQALSAVERYCYISNPDLKGIVDAGQYPVSWEVASSSEDEIVILYRSYTGAEVRYYIDPVSGDAHVTEYVSGVTGEEQPSGETLNVWDYLDWWRS